MAVHLRIGGGTACKGRKGWRSDDIWRVTCQPCVKRAEEIEFLAKIEREREAEVDGDDGAKE